MLYSHSWSSRKHLLIGENKKFTMKKFKKRFKLSLEAKREFHEDLQKNIDSEEVKQVISSSLPIPIAEEIVPEYTSMIKIRTKDMRKLDRIHRRFERKGYKISHILLRNEILIYIGNGYSECYRLNLPIEKSYKSIIKAIEQERFGTSEEYIDLDFSISSR